jgi:hypothetical protein
MRDAEDSIFTRRLGFFRLGAESMRGLDSRELLVDKK